MDDATRNRLGAQALVMKALAHPTRLFLVELLADGERCVCDLTEEVGADVSTVSRHLAQLRNAGVVRDEKRGLKVFYRLNCPCALDFFTCVDGVLHAVHAERTRALGLV
jgi:DNA-binding transcriptional ArsR family regulator